MDVRYEIRVSGKVQGVFFRAFVERHAKRLRLEGYVKNMDNGSVKIVVEGDEERIKKLLDQCSVGPDGAEVRNISFSKDTATGEYSGFSIKR